MADQKKCAHTGCTCLAPDGKKYCSQVCEDSSSETELACQCKHAGCTGTQLAP